MLDKPMEGNRNSHMPSNYGNHNNQNHPSKPDPQATCPVNIHEDITITVPIEVHAHADIKNIRLKCKGHYINEGSGTPKNISKFEVVQKMSVQIPIEFVAKVEIEDERVEFKPC